jgi:hypothetical protein
MPDSEHVSNRKGQTAEHAPPPLCVRCPSALLPLHRCCCGLAWAVGTRSPCVLCYFIRPYLIALCQFVCLFVYLCVRGLLFVWPPGRALATQRRKVAKLARGPGR